VKDNFTRNTQVKQETHARKSSSTIENGRVDSVDWEWIIQLGVPTPASHQEIAQQLNAEARRSEQDTTFFPVQIARNNYTNKNLAAG